MSSETHRINLSPDEPSLDPQTKARREVLAKIQRMTPDEIVAAGVVAGITRPEGGLTEPYEGRDSTLPAAE